MASIYPKNGQNIIKVKKLLEKTIQIPQSKRATPFLWGPFGIGKSECIREFAEEYSEKLTKAYIDAGKESELFEVIDKHGQKKMVAFDPVPVDIRLSLKDSGDIQGLPCFHVDRNGVKRTEWAIPSCFPSDPNWKGVIFFDEFNLGQISVINACYQVLSEFRLESIKFHQGVLIVAAGNYTEMSPNAVELPNGINTRVNHIDMVHDLDIWIDWALSAGINDKIISFLKLNPSELLDMNVYDPDKQMPREIRNPRSWVRVSGFLDIPEYDWNNDLVNDIGGIVGDASALRLKSYLVDSTRFQDCNEILVEGKPFKSETIDGFYGCLINCISKMISMEGNQLEKAITNIYNAISKLQKKELIAFSAKSITNSTKLNNYLLSNHKEMIMDFADWIG